MIMNNIGNYHVIKAAIHHTIEKIISETGKEYGVTFSEDVNAIFTEFITRQIQLYAGDVEAFAKHAHRMTINCEDIKLLVRRNPTLLEMINETSASLENSSDTTTKKRKRKSETTEADTVEKPKSPPEIEIINL